MRPPARLLASFAAGALVAVPGLAIAQVGAPFDTPPEDHPPARAAVDDDETDAPEVDETEEPELEDVEVEEVDEEDGDGEHGEIVSTLAGCLPSGAELHGTGLTKGHVVSQAASTGEVVLGEGDEALPVTSVEEAEALCEVVVDLADQAEAPETAKGRPDWAGPKDDEAEASEESEESEESDEVEDQDEGRHGPPDHAAKGKAKAGRD